MNRRILQFSLRSLFSFVLCAMCATAGVTVAYRSIAQRNRIKELDLLVSTEIANANATPHGGFAIVNLSVIQYSVEQNSSLSPQQRQLFKARIDQAIKQLQEKYAPVIHAQTE